MNRYKFRAWLKKEKKMVVPYAINFEGKIIFYKEPYLDDENREQIKTSSFDEIELMQYTGIKDKNGVEIYEGDIVRTYRLNVDKFLEDRIREYDEFIGVITWNEEYLEYYIQKNSNEYEDVLKPFERYYKVIGNIYEDKEMLDYE